jgi:hypothetical protein
VLFSAGATLLSFVVALLHFVTELLVFKTMSIKGAATPMIIAGKFNGYNIQAVRAKCMGQQQQRVGCRQLSSARYLADKPWYLH